MFILNTEKEFNTIGICNRSQLNIIFIFLDLNNVLRITIVIWIFIW